jgi:glycosyltransferase involved in cell wall biosynthesis
MVRSHFHNGAALLTAFVQREPVVIARDRVAAMHALLRQLIDATPFAAVHADQTSMVQYALWSADYLRKVHHLQCLRILDAHNALYLVVQRMARQAQQPLWRKFLDWEAQRLERYERTTYDHFDHVVFVTAEDRARLQLDRAAVIPICADSAATPPIIRAPGAPEVVFVGALHWPPNAQGIAWFAHKSWTTVLAACPEAYLTIIGKAPPAEVSALAVDLPQVRVTGYVSDLQPYLAKTGVFLVPLLAGGGMRVKIVDAWTWQLPVVSTTIGAEGIDYEHGKNLLIADHPSEFANAVIHLLRNPELADSLARAGRRTAETVYSWQTVYRAWDAIYSPVVCPV